MGVIPYAGRRRRQAVAVDRTPVAWVLALFFGTALAFAGLRRLTHGAGTGVTLAVQFAALAVIVAALVLFVRRKR